MVFELYVNLYYLVVVTTALEETCFVMLQQLAPASQFLDLQSRIQALIFPLATIARLGLGMKQ